MNDTLLMQDMAPDPQTDISGELLWDFALWRRAAAADIAGMLTYESMDSWHDSLKTVWLQKPPSGLSQGVDGPASLGR